MASGDFGEWNQEPTKNAAPENVAKKYAKRDDRFGTFWLTVKILLILAGCALGVWWGMHGK